jgi:hypothetical protein
MKNTLASCSFSLMGKIAVLLLFCGLLVAGCRKEHDQPGTVYTSKIILHNGRISSISYYNGSAYLGKSEYTFREGSVTNIFIDGNLDTLSRIIYKLGENGFAESSKSYPEDIEVGPMDTFFMSRVFYTYDAQNRLTAEYIGDLRNDTLRHEYTYIGDTMLIPNMRYYYEGEDLKKKYPILIPFPSKPSCLDYQYGPSDQICKLDYETNGILGNRGRHLVAYILTGEDCSCSPAMTTSQAYYTYTLDADDYVIRVKELVENCHNHAHGSTIVTNYEITSE